MLLKIKRFCCLTSLCFLLSCDTIQKPDEIADKFYQAQKEKRFKEILALCSEEAFKNNPKEDWMSLFQNKQKQTGNLLNYQKTGSQTATNTQQSLTSLDYKVNYQETTLYERLVLSKEGANYKVVGYEYSPDKVTK